MNSDLTKLSIETELLFLTSRVRPGAFDLERAQALIHQNINWNNFVSLSKKHGTAAIVYKYLLRLEGVPGHIIGKYHGIYNNLLRKNILMVSELDRIIDGLNKAGISVISLKGVTASETIFNDIAVYPSGDLDILVKLADINRVREFLEADGYQLNDVGFDEYRAYFLKELYHINLSNGRFAIEPHWNLFMRYFETPPEFWWQESIVVSSGGKAYQFLSPEKNILYTSFRLFSNGFDSFRFLVLIAEIVRHYSDAINWDKLFGYAKEYKFENVLRITMKLSSELLGAPIPHSYTNIKRLRSKVFYRHILKMMFREEAVHPLNKMLWSFLRDDLTGAAKVILRRIFPPMGEIVSRYRLVPGSPQAVLYYVLNPLLLILRKHQ
jgi:hypothetical protein